MAASTEGSARPSRRLAALTAIAALILAGPACGDDEETTTSGGSDTTDAAGEAEISNEVTVGATEYTLAPSNAALESLAPGETITSRAEAGEVTFTIINDGSETHSLVFNDAGEEIPLDQDLAPGETGELTVDVDSGFYVYYCPIGDHEARGMKAQLEVVEP